MKQYHDLLTRILALGIEKGDRTGTGTHSVFGHQMRFDLTKGFPLVTTKRVFWRGVVEELLWLLSGSTNIAPLVEKNVSIWTDWPLRAFNEAMMRDNFDGADRQMTEAEFERHIRETPGFAAQWGDLGPVYGKQWRSWSTIWAEEFGGKSIDQISDVIEQLKTTPDSRRIIVTAWNPGEIEDMRLPPCHMMFQFYTRPMSFEQRLDFAVARSIEDRDWRGLRDRYGTKAVETMLDLDEVPERYVDLQLYQRSADVFLGVPFNIASYALLLTLIAREVGMEPGEFVWTGGDTHLYSNHLDQARLQLQREERALPSVRIRDGAPGIFEIQASDIELIGYDPHPAIKAEVSV
ncbi:hypothetical protein ADL19_15030 [Streptomyces purpurogeneiscleroticus]|nr:hypothetical protein ADL19_15030 [Streptomyces purpurogeneiscleroticus]